MACSNGRVLAEGYSESKYAMRSSTMRLSTALFGPCHPHGLSATIDEHRIDHGSMSNRAETGFPKIMERHRSVTPPSQLGFL